MPDTVGRRADNNFIAQLIATALVSDPTPDTRIICARASLRVALEALRVIPPDIGAARLYLSDALTQIEKAGM